MLSVTALLLLLVNAICLTHYFYNRYAWDQWEELEIRATEMYELDREGRFYTVDRELDFFDDPFIQSYLTRVSESDEPGLSSVREVIHSQNDESYFGIDPDIRKWI